MSPRWSKKEPLVLSLSKDCPSPSAEEKQDFDKLSPNGVR